MAVVERIGEMKQKDLVKQFNFYQCERLLDILELQKIIGDELFIEALNTGLESVARKRIRSDSNPKLSSAQLVQVRRIKELVELEAMEFAQGLKLLIDNGIDPALAEAGLRRGE